MAKLPLIRLMVDYGSPLPLWPESESAAMAVARLPERLESQLRAWSSDFDRGFDYQSGWPDLDSLRSHLQRGWELREAVQQALPDCAVYFAIWETL